MALILRRGLYVPFLVQCPVCWTAAIASQGPLILATTAAGVTAAKLALQQRRLPKERKATIGLVKSEQDQALRDERYKKKV